MSEKQKQLLDPLVRQRIFPEPAQVFTFAPVDLKTAFETSIVVVDTNVLLVPYSTGAASLTKIQETFNRLTELNRLRIPGQVAREFAENRADKLKTLFQQLSRKRDLNLSRSLYPLLEELPAYRELVDKEANLLDALGQYRESIAKLLDTIAAWRWDDPISAIYRKLFVERVVVDPEIDRESLLEDLQYRQDHKIPPGYKDANNQYSGIGDLLIWKAILKIGKEESQHLIFVSGDEKTDWRYQAENRTLYPRFELIDEYRKASGGKSFWIISFAELLEQFGASKQVVEEVREKEAAAVKDETQSPGSDPQLTVQILRNIGMRYFRGRTSSRQASWHSLLNQLRGVSVIELEMILDMVRDDLARYESERKIKLSRAGAIRASARLAGFIPMNAEMNAFFDSIRRRAQLNK